MPLLDHFHAPLYPLFHFESFHSHWASILTNRLNGGVLPPEYVAAPRVKIGVGFETDLFEILIRPEGSARLAAAIEFVGPANKDRPAARRAFAIKCASYLQEGAALIVVDIVTNRGGYLPQDVFDVLAEPTTARLPGVDMLYAFACRAVASKDKQSALEAWPEKLELGKPLPTLPLWLAADCVIGVPFEDSYAETCKTLRIRAG